LQLILTVNCAFNWCFMAMYFETTFQQLDLSPYTWIFFLTVITHFRCQFISLTVIAHFCSQFISLTAFINVRGLLHYWSLVKRLFWIVCRDIICEKKSFLFLLRRFGIRTTRILIYLITMMDIFLSRRIEKILFCYINSLYIFLKPSHSNSTTDFFFGTFA